MGRTATAQEALVGDDIICGGTYTTVLSIKFHQPYAHKESPIDNKQGAYEIVTARGSRWFGQNCYRAGRN